LLSKGDYMNQKILFIALLFLAITVQSQETWKLQINSCIVNTLNPRGKKWDKDLKGGKPDLQIIITITNENGQSKPFKSKKFPNQYEIRELITTDLVVKEGDTIFIKIIDVDVIAYDIIGAVTYVAQPEDFYIGNLKKLQFNSVQQLEFYFSPSNNIYEELAILREAYNKLLKEKEKLEKEVQKKHTFKELDNIKDYNKDN